MRRRLLVLFVPILGAAASPSEAQHNQHHGASTAPATAQPYGIKVYGGFQQMVRARDYSPRTSIGDAAAAGATDGIGAVSGLRGEITILDGKPIVTYGTGAAPMDTETAALLVVASAHRWEEVRIDRDLTDDKQLEAFIVDQAKARGIDTAGSFPFRIRGTVTGYRMHVNSAPNPRFGGHGAGQPMALADLLEGDAIAGMVVGVLVDPSLVGAATHPGDRSHTHWVSEDGKRTAHLDRFGIKAGGTLMLAQPK